MRVISCPTCHESLPGIAKYCARCGEQLPTSVLLLDLVDEDLLAPTIKINHLPAGLKVPSFYSLSTGNNTHSQRVSSRLTATVHRSRRNVVASSRSAIVVAQPQSSELDMMDDELQRRANWEKIVTHKTSRVTPDLVTPPSVPVAYKSPVGATPPALISVRGTAAQKATSIANSLFFLDKYLSFVVLVIRRRFWSCGLIWTRFLQSGFAYKQRNRIESHSLKRRHWWNYYASWYRVQPKRKSRIDSRCKYYHR